MYIDTYSINHINTYNILGHIVEIGKSELKDISPSDRYYELMTSGTRPVYSGSFAANELSILSSQISVPNKIAILKVSHESEINDLLELLYGLVSEGGVIILDKSHLAFFEKHPYISKKQIDGLTYFVKPFETRENMISALIPKNGIYGEIGVFKGEFAKWINDCLKPSKFYLYDIFEGITCSGNADGNYVVNADISVEFENLKRWAPPNIIFFKGDSSTNISIMPDNYFDMIYIDGDHSYEGVKRDINVAFKKVKAGGFIMGHDYEMNMKKAQHYYNFGVDRAVNEFCQQTGQEIFTKALDGCVSFAIQVKK